jgi:hypothetical protein
MSIENFWIFRGGQGQSGVLASSLGFFLVTDFCPHPLVTMALIIPASKCSVTTCLVVFIVVVASFFVVMGAVASWRHQVDCEVTMPKFIKQDPVYYNAICTCPLTCSFQDCETMNEDGPCCGPKCLATPQSYPTTSFCARLHTYVTYYEAILRDVHYHQTVGGLLKVPSKTADPRPSPPNMTSCYYTVDKLGLGNTITLFEGNDHGLEPSYITILTLWFLFTPCLTYCLVMYKDRCEFHLQQRESLQQRLDQTRRELEGSENSVNEIA